MILKSFMPRAALAVVCIAAATITAEVPTASSAAALSSAADVSPGPTLKLISAQNQITLQQSAHQVFIDPGIWLDAQGAPLRFDVSRVGYGAPIKIVQVITQPGRRPRMRRLPPSILDGWNGLRSFVRITVRNMKGRILYTSPVTMCPDSYNSARVTPDSPLASPYPQYCNSADPFALGNVWGIQQDWAVDPVQQNIPAVNLQVGTYRVTESITAAYVRLFHIQARDATATILMKVVKPDSSARLPAIRRAAPAEPGAPAVVPVLENPPKASLPDIVPLPSWGISVTHQSGRDLLSFGATVWIGGNGPLDVEAFREKASPTMPAWQYFWLNGKVIGRVRAGTMGFDNQRGHNHWHFEQFAAYRLLTGKSELAVRSQKVGFCIAPTDEINLTLPNATWQVSSLGFAGNCGSPTALWVQEFMPVGWGDTYFQSVAGQAFDVTHLPNGTYYIKITANPEHVLRELSTANDFSLRKIILSGSPGHRQVQVPAYHGIDPE